MRAVSAAVDVHLQPAKYLALMTQKDLRVIVDRTLVVIQLGATWLERARSEVIRRSISRCADRSGDCAERRTDRNASAVWTCLPAVELMSSTESICSSSASCGRQGARNWTGSAWRLRPTTRMNSSSCATFWCHALGYEPYSMGPRPKQPTCKSDLPSPRRKGREGCARRCGTICASQVQTQPLHSLTGCYVPAHEAMI